MSPFRLRPLVLAASLFALPLACTWAVRAASDSTPPENPKPAAAPAAATAPPAADAPALPDDLPA